MKNNTPKISIITPAYNAERYIAETIESLQQQTFGDYEHVIIDDGSSDDTAKIVAKYSSEDQRIIYIKQNQNQGPSAARNRGIEESRGEYILFVDSDDTCEADTLRLLFEKATETEADVVYYNFTRFYDNNEYNWRRNHIDLDSNLVYTKKDLSKTILNVFPIITSGKIIKTKILKKNKLCFDVKYLRDEDVDFSIRLVLAAKTYAYVDYFGYNYRINNPNSESATNYKYPTQLLKILVDLNKTIVDNYPSLKQSFDNYVIDQIVGSINRQENYPDAHREAFDFASDKVIPKLGLNKVDIEYFYRPELFEYFLAVKKSDYSGMLLCRARALGDRITELDSELRSLNNNYNKQEKVINNLSSELNSIYHSASWKVTKPLRITNIINRHTDEPEDIN